MNYDFVTLPAIFWSVFSVVIVYRRQNQLGGNEAEKYSGPGWPEKIFVICTFIMVVEEILDYISEKLLRGTRITDDKEIPASRDRDKPVEELQEQGDLQGSPDLIVPEPVRGGGMKDPESSVSRCSEPMRGGRKEASSDAKKDQASETSKPMDKKDAGENVQVMVRMRDYVFEKSIKEVRERIQARHPLSVLHAGPDPQHMHIEEMVSVFRKCQRQRNSVFVVDEFENLVPLAYVLDKWNEVVRLLKQLKKDENGELKYDIISADGLAYLYFDKLKIPPLKRSIDYVMSLVTLSRLLKDGFKVIDEGGAKTMTLDEMNDLFERSEMYVERSNCWLPLTDAQLNMDMMAHPQVFWNDKWWIASPAILDWIASNPTVESQFDLKAALEKVKNQNAPHVGPPRAKAVPFPKKGSKTEEANVPAPPEKK